MCKISAKGPQKKEKRPIIEPRSPKSTMSAPNQIGEPPNRLHCAEINTTSTLETSLKRANRVRNGEPPNANGKPKMRAEMKKRKVKSANQNQNG